MKRTLPIVEIGSAHSLARSELRGRLSSPFPSFALQQSWLRMLGRLGTATRPRKPAYDVIHRFFSSLAKPPKPPLRPPPTPSRLARHDQLRQLTSDSSWRAVWAARAPRARLHFRQYSSEPPQQSRCPAPDCPHEPTAITNPPPPLSTAVAKPHPSYLASLPSSLRRLAATLPSPAGRPPTRDQLLAITTSFFDRLRIRFKWATIRSYRHYRADDCQSRTRLALRPGGDRGC